MHERSLVEALLGQVAELARVEAARRVLEVRVRVGPLSGVEPLLFRSAFDDLATGAMFEGTRLAVVEVPLRAHCRTCNTRFDVADFRFRCTACGSRDVDTVDGDAVMIESVKLALSAHEEPVHGNRF